jgi:hypothetical protein
MTPQSIKLASFHPSVASTYRPVEEYLAHAHAAGEAAVPRVALRPVDALVVHLLATYLPPPLEVIDLAADATLGATTVLCLGTPGVCRVAVAGGGNGAGGWRRSLAGHLADREPGTTAPLCELASSPAAAGELASRRGPLLVLLAADEADAAAASDRVERCLAGARQAVVLVVGVGAAGTCPALPGLVSSCTASPRRLVLARELAPALAQSSLAVVGRHDNDALDEALLRLGALFAHDFGFLDLVNQACLSALRRVPVSDQAVPEAPDEEATAEELREAVRSLRQVLDDRDAEVQALRHAVDAMTGSLSVRVARSARGAMRFVAPEGSPQRWLLRKLRRVVRSRRRAG